MTRVSARSKKASMTVARDGRVIARRRLRGYGGSGLLRVAGARFAVIGRSGGRSPMRVFHWR
jgi:hypothetical protein